ncbi:conjugative transposon protein TraK [Galbibacter sp.]|uniref:conjugative transposon protein TraK n=1 Tax=Galbibacter sp. TaxID=2918471 RepID=UPI002BC490F4|nr:conjugative transposon protein TraK [Galbibacter sp.]HLV62839.1 conjugative transposon protein TraK [Galbibacter sp.]
MFQKLKDKDNAYKEIRRISIIAICASAIIGIVAQGFNYAKLKQVQNQIYVLADGKVMQAYASSRAANIPVEAKDHIRNFHFYFFNLDPDDTQIKKNIGKALYLADNSVKKAHDNLIQQGFYTQVISSNTSQRITIDSIALNLDKQPYKFKCFAIQELIQTSGTVTRTLITAGQLKTISRSEKNAHGFLIENWRVLQNNDIKTLNGNRP